MNISDKFVLIAFFCKRLCIALVDQLMVNQILQKTHMSSELISSLKEIVLEVPADRIVDQVNELISSGQLKAGDKIPSERLLSEKFKVSRFVVRDALSQLEFYGVLKKAPHGGRVVVSSEDSAFMTMIANGLSLVKPDYQSLMETRNVLEIESAGLAAERATAEDIQALEGAVKQLEEKVSQGEAGLEEDLLFHIQVAEASKNNVLKYLISYMVSHMMTYTREYDICRDARNLKALNEHVLILKHIKARDVEKSRQSMRDHLSSLFDFIPENYRS